MANKGFLLVTMQPPPAFEEEFNAWYDAEHIPERLSVPGFLTGLRFVCLDGHPRYLAMYDLEAAAVLDSPAYHAVGYDKASPWTKRVTGRVKVWRSAGDQVYPGTAVTKPCARVRLLRFRGLKAADQPAIVAGVREAFEGKRDVSQVRVLAHHAGAGAIDYLCFVELRQAWSAPLDSTPFGAHAAALDLDNLYAPY